MDLDPEARRILSLARAARTPSAADKARIERRLGIGAGVLAGTVTTLAAGHAAANGTLGKVAALGALKWWLGGSAVVVAVASYAAVQLTPAPRGEGLASARGARHVAVAPQEPVAEPEVVEAAPEAVEAPPESVREVAPQRVHRKKHHARSEAVHGNEVDLLHQAQVAWRNGQAHGALELVREHERRFPASSLSLERDTLAVLTLCELGRKEQAARIARDLLARAPSSPLRSSVEQSCALR
jgi:hypothetical protein